MVERGLNANHMMITELTNNHRIDANDIGKHLSRLYDMIDQLQAEIYDLENQNFQYGLSVLGDFFCRSGLLINIRNDRLEPLEATQHIVDMSFQFEKS
ncbi:hypothetical protein D1007_20941 [Hordeum vulgare]|nr:hypothetical protein D1007_20941 [Hordeum vulgare]